MPSPHGRRPAVSEVHPITFRLKVFNAWRRGNDAPQPDPKTVGEDIDSICDVAKRHERERDAERDLADRLADALLSTLSLWAMSPKSEDAAKSIAAWREVRGE